MAGATDRPDSPQPRQQTQARARKRGYDREVTTDPKKKARGEDVALVWGKSDDGETLGVLRKRGDKVEPALVKKAREGAPIHGELVRLSPREEPNLYDVDVLHDARPTDARPEAREPDGAGPAQVASSAYRKGWDRLFKKRPRGALN